MAGAGRITVVSGASPVQLVGLDATNATKAYADVDMTAVVNLPVVIPAGASLILYCADSASITPTVKDISGLHTLYSTATACRAGLPVLLGPWNFAHQSVIA